MLTTLAVSTIIVFSLLSFMGYSNVAFENAYAISSNSAISGTSSGPSSSSSSSLLPFIHGNFLSSSLSHTISSYRTPFIARDSFLFGVIDTVTGKISLSPLVNLFITNHAPTANSATVTTPKDTSVNIQLSATDPDPGNRILAYTIVSIPSHGRLTNFNPLGGTITYTPNSGYTGPDSFTFRAFDTRLAASNAATVSIKVGSGSPPPPPPPTPAHLTVIKHMINDNGGTKTAKDFTISVSGNNVSPQSSFPGAESPGTSVILSPGSFSVSETGPAGYTQSLSADCFGTINAGDTKICTVTNNDNSQTPSASITITSVRCVSYPNVGPTVAVKMTVSGQVHDSHSITVQILTFAPSGSLITLSQYKVPADAPDPATTTVGTSFLSSPITPAGTYKIVAITSDRQYISTTFQAPDCSLSSGNTL